MRLKPVIQTVVTASSLITVMVGLYQGARYVKHHYFN